MSEQAGSTPTPVDERSERKKSFGKYVKRLSSVLRRGSSKDVVPKASSSDKPTEITPAVEPTTARIVPTIIEEGPKLVPTSAGPSSSTPGAYERSALQQERARALFAKYGLTLEAQEWVTTNPINANVQRVEKPIRMRVHRTCHKCENTFGPDRVCKNCDHHRCKKCPRYPPKKDKSETTGKTAEAKDTATPKVKVDEAVADLKKKRKSDTPYLTLTSKSGADLVYSPTRQRIRRTCHKCDNLFQPVNAAVCQHCQHQRCTKCPRAPEKKKKWPDGYPGDAAYEDSEVEEEGIPIINRAWKKARQRVRWTCCECERLFTEGEKKCACHHTRCETCTRQPPKKIKKEFDPAVVRSVEEKLSRFRLERLAAFASSQSPT